MSALMAAAYQMFGHQLCRLHIVGADNIDFIEIAGAGSKDQRRLGFRRFRPQFRRLIDRALAEHNVQCTVAQEVGHPTTIFRMLDAGLGISVIPTLAIPPEGLPQLAVRPLLPRINREIMLVHRRNRALSPVAQAAWDLVRDVAAQRANSARNPRA